MRFNFDVIIFINQRRMSKCYEIIESEGNASSFNEICLIQKSYQHCKFETKNVHFQLVLVWT